MFPRRHRHREVASKTSFAVVILNCIQSEFSKGISTVMNGVNRDKHIHGQHASCDCAGVYYEFLILVLLSQTNCTSAELEQFGLFNALIPIDASRQRLQ